MSVIYKYQEIMDAYNQAKAVAEDNIGIDIHTMQFIKKEDSIDFRVIDEEIKKMYDAGKKVGEIYPGMNIFKTLKNIVTIPDYMKKVATITDYIKDKPGYVNRYAIEIWHPEDTGQIEFSPQIVVSDLYNAFNHGVAQGANKESRKFFHIFSPFRVVKKVA